MVITIGATAGPGFDEPMALLAACHDRVRHYALLAEKLALHVQQNGNDAMAREAASSILRYFDIAAPLHHQDEEEDLFPALLAVADAQLNRVIRDIEAEHAALGELWQSLRCQLVNVRDGGVQLDVSLAGEFARRYPEHAAREDMEIYPHATRLLPEAELVQIGLRMANRRGV
ncbi:hemerythrin domain-containing protein [Chitinilyticum piscinae]|uniref:Hemerythrin domain-containing protein n=1 Tax=Chitinilyticum piscinae TaxID=2866724 RepID=A0A8J7K9P3_9NEIS|nr:hemerythrin domain-containing protein [Chitinilyticum piscinae]MBE9608464.1 hemerythrin domain-containing protein [Chitinilyticum piscinae]